MEDKMVEGLWDCPYCMSKAIGGLKKHCPMCGHPQDKDTTFYLGEEKHYLTEQEAQDVGGEPDWKCDYCDSMNNARFIYCSNCGAPREQENKNYFDLHKAPEEDKPSEPVAPPPKKKMPFWKLGLIGLAILAVIIGIVALVMPKDYSATIAAKKWNRTIAIEEYKTVEESDWSIPSGGRQLYTKSEIKSYRQVLDHYETKTKEVPYQVQDGYETTYTDNGNGTFTEHSTPKYKTEYRTETYEEPVYREEPVYATKYYYEIDKWTHTRDVKSEGAEDAPYWGETALTDKEREGKKTEKYELVIEVEKKKKTKQYTYSLSQAEWENYKKGQKVTVTIKLGDVEEIQPK